MAKSQSETIDIGSTRGFIKFMTTLMRDVVKGDVSPQQANAAVNAGNSVMEMMKIELQWGESGSKTALPMIRDDETPQDSSPVATKALPQVVKPTAEIEEYADEDESEDGIDVPMFHEQVEKKLQQESSVRKILWNKNCPSVARRLADGIIEVNPERLLDEDLNAAVIAIQRVLNSQK